MEYCGPRGIPYTQFIGWDQIDQDAALAWLVRDRGKCDGCGTVSSDWLNAFDEDGEPVANIMAPVFHAVDVHCAGCAARAAHEKTFVGDRPAGLHTGFVPNPDAEWVLPASLDSDS